MKIGDIVHALRAAVTGQSVGLGLFDSLAILGKASCLAQDRTDAKVHGGDEGIDMAFPVDIKFINEAERKLGVEFPASFVLRMVKNNGGEVSTPGDSWQLHPFLDSNDQKRLKRTCNDIVLETRKAREWSGFPDNAIVIGSNGGGDRLVLLPSSDAPAILGPVYWWDHGTDELIFLTDEIGHLE